MYEGEDIEDEQDEMEREFMWECCLDMATDMCAGQMPDDMIDEAVRELAQEKFYEMTGGYHR